jgi:hypothetical protein
LQAFLYYNERIMLSFLQNPKKYHIFGGIGGLVGGILSIEGDALGGMNHAI